MGRDQGRVSEGDGHVLIVGVHLLVNNGKDPYDNQGGHIPGKYRQGREWSGCDSGRGHGGKEATGGGEGWAAAQGVRVRLRAVLYEHDVSSLDGATGALVLRQHTGGAQKGRQVGSGST